MFLDQRLVSCSSLPQNLVFCKDTGIRSEVMGTDPTGLGNEPGRGGSGEAELQAAPPSLGPFPPLSLHCTHLHSNPSVHIAAGSGCTAGAQGTKDVADLGSASSHRDPWDPLSMPAQSAHTEARWMPSVEGSVGQSFSWKSEPERGLCDYRRKKECPSVIDWAHPEDRTLRISGGVSVCALRCIQFCQHSPCKSACLCVCHVKVGGFVSE